MASQHDTTAGLGVPEPVARTILAFCASSQSTLSLLSQASRSWHALALPALFAAPRFGVRSDNAVRSLNALTATLGSPRTAHTAALVRSLDLSGVGESMYSEVDETWLATVLAACTSLHSLDLRGVGFLTDACVQLAASRLGLSASPSSPSSPSPRPPPARWQDPPGHVPTLPPYSPFDDRKNAAVLLPVPLIPWPTPSREPPLPVCPSPRLSRLSIAATPNISPAGVDTLLRLVGRHLAVLDMSDRPTMAVDSCLVSLVSLTPALKDLRLGGTPTHDTTLLQVLQLRCLETLDLSGCLRITDTFAMAFSNPLFSSPLRSLVLRGCQTLTDQVVPLLAKSMLVKTLRQLDVRGCTRLKLATIDAWDLFTTYLCCHLDTLAMSYAPFDRLAQLSLLPPSSASSPGPSHSRSHSHSRSMSQSASSASPSPAPAASLSAAAASRPVSPPPYSDIDHVVHQCIQHMRNLRHLTLSDITETSRNETIEKLSAQLPLLETVRLERLTGTRDFIVTDMYADVVPSAVDDGFVRRFNTSRGDWVPRVQMTLVVQDAAEDGSWSKW
ncbi:hypothetical protein BC831DRAFT_462386 [Entophlyctis helioformis]|nr:hypothetical protein BC831DRAFT_462386 [Entophlyctis helioformis]